VDALIVVAVTQANVEPINRDPALQRAYATYGQTPPDHLRRPVSINAIAQSLNLSFETVRRRVLKLTVLGLFKQTRQGIYAPAKVVFGKQHEAALQGGYERLWALHRALESIGFCEAYPEDLAWDDADPLRLVARVSTEYLLRLVETLMEECGDPVDVAIWLAIFSDAPTLGPKPIAPKTRQPFRRVSQRLGLSEETVRRRALALVERGLCDRVPQGVFVSTETLQRPAVRLLLERNRRDVRRMFASLAEFGIPQAWQSTSVARSTAA
jgi:DNA-binding Lrp family transcriptional regulator